MVVGNIFKSQMNKQQYITLLATIAFVLFTLIGNICCGQSYANRQLTPGSRYKIVGNVYLSGIYKDLNDRQLTKQLAFGSLTAIRFSGPEVAFQHKVPIGTIMTIIGPAPKRVPLPFFAKRFFISLQPNELSEEIDVILQLNRGIDGNLDGLNPELFSRE